MSHLLFRSDRNRDQVSGEPKPSDRLDAGIRSGLLRDVHSVLVSRAGQIVLRNF